MTGKNQDLPVIKVEGATLPEAWEMAVMSVWDNGVSVPTEYDKPGNPPSREATMIIVVRDPFAEPRIHRAFPGGLEELEVYRQEVVDGVHDHWIDPEAGKWTYTYHKRLFDYEAGGKAHDQIAYIIDKLSESTFSRRAQAITWNVELDPPTDAPPCLQRIWCRLLEDGDGGLSLCMNTHWRSRDAYKAAFMNIFALTDLQRAIAEKLSEKTGRSIRVGRYTDISDSFHIYGSYFSEFEGFLNLVQKRAFEERTWNSSFAEEFFENGRQRLRDEKKQVSE